MKHSFLMGLAPAVLSALLGWGCASNLQFVRFPDQTKRVEDPANGRIYVLRPTSFGGSASMEIWDSDKHVANTGPESFVCWERQPGHTQVSGKEENVSSVDLDVQADQVYYIFQHVRFGWVQARTKLELVPEERGLELLKSCKPPKPGRCVDHPECRASAATQ